ncbi:MAG: hypothetical protein NW208_02270 [Bryobacter sp.]|nr:hypothetical protein [Bryobacter sp.]
MKRIVWRVAAVLLAAALLAQNNVNILRLKRETAELFLERNKGRAEGCVVSWPPQANAEGEYPLGYQGQTHEDLTQPNPAYFQHVEWLAKRARRWGSGYGGAGNGGGELQLAPLCPEAKERPWAEADLAFFGRYLGRRFAKVKGIRWVKNGPRALDDGLAEFETIRR